MSLLARVGLAVLLTTLVPQALARDEAPPSLVQGLAAFSSDEGIGRFVRAVAKVDFPALANQFEAQSNAAFCGPTTAAIVLNAVHGRSRDLPRDRSRLRAEDLQYIPSGFDITVPRFTQDNVISKGQKTRRKQAAVALGRKVLCWCWAMMRDGTDWRVPTPRPTSTPGAVPLAALSCG